MTHLGSRSTVEWVVVSMGGDPSLKLLSIIKIWVEAREVCVREDALVIFD